VKVLLRIIGGIKCNVITVSSFPSRLRLVYPALSLILHSPFESLLSPDVAVSALGKSGRGGGAMAVFFTGMAGMANDPFVLGFESATDSGVVLFSASLGLLAAGFLTGTCGTAKDMVRLVGGG